MEPPYDERQQEAGKEAYKHRGDLNDDTFNPATTAPDAVSVIRTTPGRRLNTVCGPVVRRRVKTCAGVMVNWRLTWIVTEFSSRSVRFQSARRIEILPPST